MKATSITSAYTRIIPASKEHQIKGVTKNGDGSLSLEFGNGSKGVLSSEDKDLQAFAIYTMLNGDCTQ